MVSVSLFAWALATLAQVTVAAGPRPDALHRDLTRIANELEFNEKGATRWLGALDVTRVTVRERVLLVSPTGEVLAVQDGGKTGVTFSGEINLRLEAPDAPVVIVHNHPDNASLSANDLVLLARPGVRAIVAVGHDGSFYLAAPGPHYDAGTFERDYGRLRSLIRKRLRLESDAGQIRRSVADAHAVHVLALALARAGIIDYHAVMSRSARAAFDPAAAIISGMVGSAAQAVRP